MVGDGRARGPDREQGKVRDEQSRDKEKGATHQSEWWPSAAAGGRAERIPGVCFFDAGLVPILQSRMNLFDGPGAARALARSLDWSATPLGAVERWPSALRLSVRLMLASGFPACVLWGDEYTQIYNDAMAGVFADKHPAVMGQASRVGWPEAWHLNEPVFTRVMAGETVTLEDAPYQSLRRGALEELTITVTFAPIADDDGAVRGIFITLLETTRSAAVRRMERENHEIRDASERAHLEVERARALSDSVLETMNDAYFVLDREYRFISVNRASERLLGVGRETLLGHVMWDIYKSADHSAFGVNFRRAMEQRTDAHFTAPYAGEQLSLLCEVNVYPTEQGGIAVFWRDISEQFATQQALEESEARFRAVQDASPLGSTLYRAIRAPNGTIADFEFVYENPASARLAGVRTMEFAGRRLLDVYPHAVPNGVFDLFVRAVEDKSPKEWEAHDIRDGIDLGVHFIAAPIGDLLHVNTSDVTERLRLAKEREGLLEDAREAYAEARSAEARLRDVFEQAPLAIAVLSGPTQIYTIVSPQYAKSPGNGRMLIGKTMLEAFPEIDPSGFPRILNNVYRTGEPYNAREQLVPLADGDGVVRDTYFDIGYQPLRNSQGDVYAVASVVYNVTEQIRARQQVEAARLMAEHAQQEAEAANKAKGEFLAVMSHELRTPLNAIGGYAELIDIGVHGPVTEAQHVALSRIQQSQRHLLGLINGVLNYSRVEAGAVTYDLARVNVAEAVAEAHSLVAPQLRARGLVFAGDGCTPDLFVTVDREKMQQILLNLLSNAVKFTDPGGRKVGRVDVSCEQRDNNVFLHVCDTGDGIEPDKLRAVFEPFVQIDQRLTRRSEGVGLGLTISRDLARGMGGDLTATSTVGEGSIFTLMLPAA